MRVARTLFVVALLPLFSGCLPIPAIRKQGLITQEGNKPVFTSCDGTQRQILTSYSSWKEIQEEIVSHLQKSGALFGDLSGYDAGWRNGSFEVVWFRRLDFSPEACSEPDFKHLVLRAFGNEPNWNLRVIDKRLHLDRPGEPSLEAPYLRNRGEVNQPSITADVNGETLSLWLTQERCVDPSTGGVYADTARLQLGDKTLQGCSYQGEGSDYD